MVKYLLIPIVAYAGYKLTLYFASKVKARFLLMISVLKEVFKIGGGPPK